VNSNLRRGNGSIICNCCWSSTAESSSGPESLGTHDHILLPRIRDSTNLQRQVLVSKSHRNKVVSLYPWAISTLVVTSYESQGYDIRIRNHQNTSCRILYIIPLNTHVKDAFLHSHHRENLKSYIDEMEI
jgi:hypothetical protein